MRCFCHLAIFLSLFLLPCVTPAADVQDAKVAPKETSAADETLSGHSFHGEAFNEGPRQAAILIDGLASIDFPTSTKNADAQQFFEQGVAQLHGFWYLEAERSFRQAAKLDPEMAIAYWGMAMANVNNQERARGLIDEATEKMKRKTSPREKRYIEALDRWIAPKAPKEDGENEADEDNDDDEDDADKEDDDQKEADREAAKEAKRKRGARYITDLEKVLDDHPNDIEAKAFLAVHLWQADREGVKLTSRYAVDALLAQVFAVAPEHPAHHYRIHLWDKARPENALEAAAACGPAMPAVAHMWHMPGHIYSKLHRYHDAAWQQEASARVDHAHMTRVGILPDQIHNFAHNNEWLTRNLLFLGRVEDAIAQAENLISLPRHPKFNTLDKRGSAQFGRKRLIQALTEFALWEALIEASTTAKLPPSEDEIEQADRLGWLAVAHFRSGDQRGGSQIMRKLQRKRIEWEMQRLDLADSKTADAKDREPASEGGDSAEGETESQGSEDESNANGDDADSIESVQKRLERIRPILARVGAASAIKSKKASRVKSLGEKAKLDKLILARWLSDAGDRKTAIEIASAELKKRKNEVRPLAILVDLLWQDQKKEPAKKHFQQLRKVAADADLSTPLLAKLNPVAKALNIKGDWRIRRKPAKDIGHRPDLDSLGPATWQRRQAPSWEAVRADGDPVADTDLKAMPRVVIFYLGFGCLHCVEQLHEFEPKLKAFQDAGIDVVGISNEDVKTLAIGLDSFGKPIAIPLFADSDQAAFKAFGCWDDFEDQPLHGTFLVDQEGRVLWQDVSYEPFLDADFLLEEAKRLLPLP